MPRAGGILFDLEQVSSEHRQRFIPAEYDALAAMWVRFVQTSHALGHILRAHYRARGPRPSLENVDNLVEELQECARQGQLSDVSNYSLRMHAYQVELFYQATVTVLHRPYVFGGLAAVPATAPLLWHKTALAKARAAASNTNNILEKLIEIDAIQFLKSMIITAIDPSMQIHLFDYKSVEPLISGLAGNRLQLCMLILSKLRETYWSAGVMYRLFERAQRILQESKRCNLNTVPRLGQDLDQVVNDCDTRPNADYHNRLQKHIDTPVLDSSLEGWPLMSNTTTDALPFWDGPLSFDTVGELLGPGSASLEMPSRVHSPAVMAVAHKR
ncbi:uncharacterized protein Z519_09191 [Cladophialophora bantiana CBS 173.52]|uniref:Transcription factor domain-containing protein n=1 Tax=Cladophialophora bantiana (strain ATCC 10958 / CBS 173.52 / CDC B-1940 / NIH 8579) TaxID=1442370 RepID=A0A0D2I128_CLAB1|nr:uncharacterized protein Z519_09191 [Cladophialophora bantiana CBS 173.52]KIW90544.1 hypothetical protein Z519_09191 [Cladophialophora bantiana CBS 173.52]